MKSHLIEQVAHCYLPEEGGDFTNAESPVCRAFAELFQKFDPAAAHRNLPPFHLPHVGTTLPYRGGSSKIIILRREKILFYQKILLCF
jgi:hypothetical protein